LSRTPIIFCGLDFCCDDIREHVMPHPFSERLAAASSRFRPLDSELYQRVLMTAPKKLPGTRCRVSDPLSIYAASFQALPEDLSRRVWRLFPSPQAVGGMRDADESLAANLIQQAGPQKSTERLFPFQNYPDLEKRALIVQKLLKNWQTLIGEGNFVPKTAFFRTCPVFLRIPSDGIEKTDENDGSSGLMGGGSVDPR
jgi:hypothetical protein